jgi:TLC domain
MLGHHVLTLCLFVIGHVFHVERMGFLVLALLNFSNPFLHFAKIMNYTGQPAHVKAPAFLLFAISFAISRCVIFPMMLKTSGDAVLQHLADGDRTVIMPAIVCFTGMGILQLLQFYWMHRIIKCVPVTPRSSAEKF